MRHPRGEYVTEVQPSSGTGGEAGADGHGEVLTRCGQERKNKGVDDSRSVGILPTSLLFSIRLVGETPTLLELFEKHIHAHRGFPHEGGQGLRCASAENPIGES